MFSHPVRRSETPSETSLQQWENCVSGPGLYCLYAFLWSKSAKGKDLTPKREERKQMKESFIKGLFIKDLEKHADHRGSLMETFRIDELKYY